MILCDDLSPPEHPSPDQQRAALRQGLGRAVLWARRGVLQDEVLLEACLRDLRYDQQVEDSRGEWLWGMIKVTNAEVRFRVPLLHALYALSDERSTNQLCELAFRYAQDGDDSFRERLYAIVEQRPFPDRPWLGERELLDLDGLNGLLFAARVRGKELADRDWEWNDRNLVEDAVEQVGNEAVRTLLMSSPDEAVRRFSERWREEKERTHSPVGRAAHVERMRSIPVDDVLQAARGETRCYWFLGWGQNASAADLRLVLQDLWNAKNPKVVAGLLGVFWSRPLPEFDERLIELCGSDDDEVRRFACKALERNSHPAVRSFAFDQLENGDWDGTAVSLLVRNFDAGDEDRILHGIRLSEGDQDRHSLFFDVVELLKHNAQADPSRLGLLTYAATPCENCRFYAARILVEKQVAPAWLLEECQHDSCEDCRKLSPHHAAS